MFVLRHNFIDEADATEFYKQAQRYPSMKLTDCMQKQAIELLNFRIMIDPEFNIIDRRLRHDWQTKLTVLQVAKLIIKYFSPVQVKNSKIKNQIGCLRSDVNSENDFQTRLLINLFSQNYLFCKW